jgi:F-type H+-transporting ATPase subunit epsilon
MTMTIHVDIVSAETELYSGLAEMVFAPAIEESFFVSGGILEIQPHIVTILSDSASRTEDLDEAAVLKAKEEAELAFHDRDGEVDFEHVQQQMVEARAKYEALQKLRGRSGRS